MTGERVLLVDDEVRFRRAIVRSLKGHDYDVRESATGGAGIEDAREFEPDLVLLDLMLPDVSGLDVCRELRRFTDSPIIVLSVLGDERTKIRALDEGADDYLTKPFGTGELLARIRAVLRRGGATSPESDVLEAGPLRIEQANHLVRLNGNEIRLTPTEFSLLQLFASNAGKVLRYETILKTIWGEDYSGDSESLRTHVKQLRAKLGDNSINPRFIRTDPGIGYRFIHPVV